MKTRSLLLAASLALASLAAASPARAVERQHHLGLGAGLSMLKVDDKSTMSIGGGAGLHYAYGLSDQFNFMAEYGSSIVARGEDKGPGIPNTRPAGVDTFALGAGYVIDVMRWVPYVGVLGSGTMLSGGSLDRTQVIAGAQLAAGIDYQFSRHWAAGVAYRQHLLFSQMGTYPTYATAWLRVEYVWGY